MPQIVLMILLVLVTGETYAASQPHLSPEDEENIQCLRKAYPEITGYDVDSEGIWLNVGKRRVAYSRKNITFKETDLAVDVRTSMKALYALEPKRPKTDPGYAPGRKRSYELFQALYGSSASEVRGRLVPVSGFGQTWLFSKHAADAFGEAVRTLDPIVKKKPELREWLTGDGTFCWRKIAGENVLSAHSFGVAFDIGVKKGATYWRWAKTKTHPLQKTYPSEIVSAFEEAGFIWGGKWHEFDLMHFEYRPELLCKARKLKERKIQKINIREKVENFLILISRHFT